MNSGLRRTKAVPLILLFLLLAGFSSAMAADQALRLQELLAEALRASPELQAARARAAASAYRVPQASSLPDPMLMVGYQNEGTSRYTFNEAADSQYMFSASQLFYYPGKRALRGEAAGREAESLAVSATAAQLRIVTVVKELYYDLFFVHQSLDLLKEKENLLKKLEDAALARYAAGRGMQQDVLMAQSEKYMLIEREEMLKQRSKTIEAGLNAALGREQALPLARPLPPAAGPDPQLLPELIAVALANSPEIRAREKMVDALSARVKVAEKEYYPDITVTGNYGLKGSAFEDMWSLSTTVNIPLYHATRQKPAKQEAEASLTEAKNELQAAKLKLGAAIQENHAALHAAERLMLLYRQGLSEKIRQDFQAALAGYATGKGDAAGVIARLRSITDVETSYWNQLVEREKARARIEALAGVMDNGAGEGQ